MSALKITVLSVGTRGDVQPLVAFAAALERAGHEVKVATLPPFEGLVADAGLEFAPLAEGRVSRGQQTAEGRWWWRSGSRRLPAWVGFVVDVRSVARRRLADALAATDGAEVIVANELAVLLGWQASRRHATPLVRVRLCPPPRWARGPLGAPLRQAAWLVALPWLAWVRRGSSLQRLPLREPLSRLGEDGGLELNAFSSAVAPVNSRPGEHLTGFWQAERDHDEPPPARLEEFLREGPAPVAIGFGSMGDSDPAVTATLARAAIEAAGVRGILLGEQYAPHAGGLPPSMVWAGAVDHEWLFARCAAVVHHGGAGTVAATLRAGLPSVVVPHIIDQYTWARQLHELGAAAAPIPRRRLTAERLAKALREVLGSPAMRARALELGEQISQEEGIARALEVFDSYMGVLAPSTA